VLADIDAPCQGTYVRGVDAAPIEAIADANQLGDLGAFRAGLEEPGVALTAVGAIDDGASGFALFTRDRADACDAPELHERVLVAATRDAGWRLREVARLDGSDLALTVADVDGDGALDAIVDGGIYRAGRFELWRPVLAIPWPAGLGCDGADGD
jgi:hypothetical protein